LAEAVSANHDLCGRQAEIVSDVLESIAVQHVCANHRAFAMAVALLTLAYTLPTSLLRRNEMNFASTPSSLGSGGASAVTVTGGGSR
jgi:hypothetical protein